MLLPALSTPSNTTKVPRCGGFEAATADMVKKRLKIVLAARVPRLRLRGVKDYVKTSGTVPLPMPKRPQYSNLDAWLLLVSLRAASIRGLYYSKQHAGLNTCQKKLIADVVPRRQPQSIDTDHSSAKKQS